MGDSSAFPVKGVTRRGFTLSLIGSVVLPQVARCQEAPGSPYSKAGGRMLDINGRELPRNLVFRFLPVTLPLVSIRVTQLFGLGKDTVHGFSPFHPGVDFGAPVGTPVFATAAGMVSRAGRVNGYGNVIDIEHGLGFSSRYAHLSSFSVAEGQAVDRNTQIGLTGNSGHSTGPHLHYEVRIHDVPVDPVAFILKANEIYNTLS
jgi:murein DD-endopeptidase MepM/ murein hydrolase activator NlpD